MLNIHGEEARIENGWMEGPALKIYVRAECEEVAHLLIHTDSDLFKAATGASTGRCSN